MKSGDLVKFRAIRDSSKVDMTGLLINASRVGSEKIGRRSTMLYDILVSELGEILTISDIFFEIWRIE